MLGNLDFVMLHVPSIDEVLPFYTEQLGMTLADQMPGFVQFNRDGGAIFAISSEPTESQGSPVELWWLVSNADELHDTLASRGVEIVAPPSDQPFGRAFEVKDPAGNIIRMFQARS